MRPLQQHLDHSEVVLTGGGLDVRPLKHNDPGISLCSGAWCGGQGNNKHPNTLKYRVSQKKGDSSNFT